jgi:hypothetical protein
MSRLIYCYAKCRYAERHYADAMQGVMAPWGTIQGGIH